MTLTGTEVVAEFGPPPPYDAECGAVVAGLPPFPPLTMETIPDMRAGADTFMPRPSNEDLERDGRYAVEERLVPGASGAPDVPLIICRPTSTSAAAPALYYLHGGGMFGGSARDTLSDIVALAAPLGAAVISVEYRLAPETRHPGPVEDGYAGVAWAAAHAEEIGVDPARIVLIGGSAGGGLAAAVALLARDRRGPALFGQLLMCPMLDDRNNSLSVQQMASLWMWNRSDNEIGWSALLGSDRGGPDVSPYAAPARATDLSGLPPTFIDVGSADSFRDEDVAFASRIWAAGGVAELHVWPGGFHGFEAIAPHAALSKAAVRARANWLERLLAPAASEQ
ncbi:alpha/beta hydrolase [Microbacterium deminutum]|uniref:Alpha/beta hydrolase n=1 Tax=Microbacterium deminutum TaxID=344164 RepID=A0ABP5CIG5_9MICO